MIDKIIKAVKSSNKRRGRNITIGAVIGFLLSCTVVMGAGEIGLEIGNSENRIEFKKDGTVFIPKKEDGSDKDPYLDNSWEEGAKTYTNNTIISGYSGSGESYGVKLSGDLGKFKFINNALISGYSGSDNSYGILYLDSSKVEDIINTGVVTVRSFDTTYGIYLGSSKAEGVTNSGIISTANDRSPNAHGICLEILSVAEYIENTGLIYSVENGISLFSSEVKDIINTGVTYGGSYGINQASRNTLAHIINTGVIYGRLFAVRNGGGTIAFLDNYGILVAERSSIMEGSTTNPPTNYGLHLTGTDGKVTVDAGKASNDPTEIITGYNENGKPIKRNLVIKNAELNGLSGAATSTQSIEVKDSENKYDNFVLNGKNETIKVSGVNNKITGSIINAYGTAVAFEGANGQLTLSGTTVNGGADEANNITVSGSDNGDTLILQSGEVEYAGGGEGTQNTIINGNIDMKAGDDTLTFAKGTIINGNTGMGDNDDILTVEAGSIINGTLDGGMGSDTLNFNSKTTRDAVNGGINIQHNISGFEKMNINTNVTLFEKTVKDDGSVGDLTVTDAENITIGADGILTLRIDISKLGASGDAGKIVGHALYGNTGTIASTGGKLLLAVNGAGNESIISFGGTELDNSLITGSRGNFDTTSKLHTIESIDGANNEVKVVARWIIPEIFKYKQLNKIYHGILSVDGLGNFIVDDDERLSTFIGYLNDIYAGNPYSYSSELSRKSAGMFRDIVTENIFKPEANKWMIYGGLTHVDGGTKDTYYGKGYYTYDIGSSDMDADTKITGAYMLGEYGVSDTLTSGVVIGGNKLKSDLSNGSKVDGSALYLGAYAKKYVGNLKVTAGAGFQYGDYDADRLAVNNAASSKAEPVIKYSDDYNDMTYDIYLNGRYSHNIGDNLFLEPYGTLSYTYIDQDGANEGSKALAIETDSKSFDYTVGKVGVDLKKVIPHEKGKSTLSAGVSYTKILDGADEEHITGRFKGGRDFDILAAHKNEHSIGLNAKYALELENGVLFDIKGTYAVERDSHNGAGKNKAKGEWIVGAGLGYKF